jgi:hypothetical protein
MNSPPNRVIANEAERSVAIPYQLGVTQVGRLNPGPPKADIAAENRCHSDERNEEESLRPLQAKDERLDFSFARFSELQKQHYLDPMPCIGIAS